MFLARIAWLWKGARLPVAVGAFLVVGCTDNQTGVSSPTVFDTEIALSRYELTSEDSLIVTITVTNKTWKTQKLLFGCGYTIGTGLWNGNGEWVAGDQICPTEVVELSLGPGESEAREELFRLVHYIDGHQLPPGRYVARGGLWGLADSYTWAEAEFSIAVR